MSVFQVDFYLRISKEKNKIIGQGQNNICERGQSNNLIQ